MISKALFAALLATMGLATGCLNLDNLVGDGSSDAGLGARLPPARDSDAQVPAVRQMTERIVDATAPCFESEGAFCHAHCGAIFCSDFDGTKAFAAWDTSNQDHGALSIDSNASPSAPSHFVADVATLTTSTGSVDLHKSLSSLQGKSGVLHWSLQLRIDRLDANGAGAVLANLVIGEYGSDWTNLQISVRAARNAPGVGAIQPLLSFDTSATSPASYTEYPLASTFPIGEWVLFDLILKVPNPNSVDGRTVTLTLNSKTSFTANVPLRKPNLPITLSLGPGYVDAPSSPWTVRYDNVLAEFAP